MLPTSRADHSRQATRVTLVGMLLDAALGVGKVLGGLLFHSHALVVDGIHSFSDVVSDLMVLGLARLSRQAPDSGHPYGHERFETFGTVLMGTLLIAVAGAIAWDSVLRLWEPGSPPVPDWPVLVVAGASVLSKEWIFRYTRAVGQRIRSDLIIANAWHSRSDALSSIIVFVGALGAMAGLPWLDSAAAVLVALIIAGVGWNLAWENIKELVDTAMPEEDSRKIYRLARDTEGVRDVHDLRTRKMGPEFLLDLHIQVSPDISVSEGHQIGLQAAHRIRDGFETIRDITFHVDFENDQPLAPDEPELPLRQEVLTRLGERWQPRLDLAQVPAVQLHYLKGRVSLDLYLNREQVPSDPESLREELQRRARDLPWLGELRLWVSAA